MPGIRSKLGKARSVNREATAALKDAVKGKLSKARADNRVIALELIQILLVLMVALSALFFVFPESRVIRAMLSAFYPEQLVSEYLAQLPQPPFSYLLFCIVVVAAIWVYGFTDWYRHERRQSRSMLSLELFVLALMFIAIMLYFDPAINIFPPPLSYAVFGVLLVALAALFMYMRFFRD